jgi:hypothetical protein
LFLFALTNVKSDSRVNEPLWFIYTSDFALVSAFL